jgi:transcriptional regulator with XRE-family HTH domain
MGNIVQYLETNHIVVMPFSDPGPDPLLHGQLEDTVRDLRQAELVHAGLATASVKKGVANTASALRAFRAACRLDRHDRVESELMDPAHFARSCDLIYGSGISDKTARRHVSELNKRIRPWAMALKKEQLAHCTTLSQALRALMTMSGHSIAELARRVSVKANTLQTWASGKEVPSTPATLQAIGRVEAELGAPAGMLSRFCEIKKIYMRPERLKIDIELRELKRVRRALPNDFETLSADKQQEIYDWVMSNIILSPTDDEGDEVGSREPYRCKLRRNGWHVDTPGTFRAPDRLRQQVEGLVKFKTAILLPEGKQRDSESGRWTSDESVSSKLIVLEMFFGALHKKGTSKENLGLENVLDTKKIDVFINYMRKRRGLYTETTPLVLMSLAGHTNTETGYITQHKAEILGAKTRVTDKAWADKCAAANAFLWSRWRQIKPHIEVGRDPFLPIRAVIDTRTPLHAYYAIADEIRIRTPLAAANELQRARCYRDLIMFRYTGQFPLRAGNFSRHRVLPKGAAKTSMTKLRRRRVSELWWDPKEKHWVHRQPKESFKNRKSPATKDIEIVLLDTDELYRELDEYLRLRPVLLDGHPDPEVLFVADMTQGNSNRTTFTPSAFNQVWKNMIRRYGIYNPYTGQGAIAGLKVHPPHAARHILATHILRVDGSFAKAAAAIFDTEAVTMKRYAEFSAEHQYELARDVIMKDPPRSRLAGRSL